MDAVFFCLSSVRDADGNAAFSRQRQEGDDDNDPEVRHLICLCRPVRSAACSFYYSSKSREEKVREPESARRLSVPAVI